MYCLDWLKCIQDNLWFSHSNENQFGIIQIEGEVQPIVAEITKEGDKKQNREHNARKCDERIGPEI